MCQTFGALPREGGILDQDALDMKAMLVVREVQEEYTKLQQEKEETRANRKGRSPRSAR